MARLAYTPDRGDLVHVNLSPSAGRELTGPHYALILSPKSYNRANGVAICVAITSRLRGGPFEVPLAKGHLPPKAGVGDVASAVLCDALRQLDFRERSMEFIGKCPAEVLDEVTIRSLALIDPEAEF
jgi:mRNA-degrading endonuclease toxin of MazEF toxin-antitoxin module